MQELVNLSNDSSDLNGLLGGKPERLQELLSANNLDGIEFMCCAPWQEENGFPSGGQIKGFHLWFWGTWLDFWQGNTERLQEDFGSLAAAENIFGPSRKAWLETYRQNFRQARLCGAEYAVFHVADVRPGEMPGRKYCHTSKEVVQAALEVVNELADELPAECPVLFENLWWPGLTLLEPELADRLLAGTNHKAGIMLDTGHLMNTNWQLRTERESVDYVMSVLDKLGSLSQAIYGIHLHQSQSGEFVCREREMAKQRTSLSAAELMNYVLRTDQHQPLKTPYGIRLIERINPQVIVHEFVPKDFSDWQKKIMIQRQSLGLA